MKHAWAAMHDVRRLEARSLYREAMRRLMDAEGPRVRRAAMRQLGLGYVPRTRKAADRPASTPCPRCDLAGGGTPRGHRGWACASYFGVE